MRIETQADLVTRLATLVKDRSTTYLDELWSIPTSHYFSAERAALEKDHVLTKNPIVVARSSQLAEPHSFLGVNAFGTPILLTRTKDGSIRAAGNTCRHRGTQLVRDGQCGTTDVLKCPYHGWQYDMDGRLKRMPHHFDSFVPIEKAHFGLIKYPAAERHGFVFIQLTPGDDDLDLDTYFGPAIDADFDAFDLANWRLSRDVVFDEPMNWKVVADGILDPYHPQFVHGETVAKYINNNVYLFDTLSAHVARLVMSKKTVVDADVTNLSANPAKYLFVNYVLLPNTFLVHQSRHFECWTIEPHPTDPQRSLTHIRILTSPTGFDSEQARDKYVKENWTRFMRVGYEEDWGVARLVQTGVTGGAMTETVVGRNEAPVHFLHSFLGRCIGDTVGLAPLL